MKEGDKARVGRMVAKGGNKAKRAVCTRERECENVRVAGDEEAE